MATLNKRHIGSTLDSFLEEEGILEQTEAVAMKRAITYQIIRVLEKSEMSQAELARRMGTSKAAVNRLLNPDNASITLQTLAKVATALGKKLSLSIK